MSVIWGHARRPGRWVTAKAFFLETPIYGHSNGKTWWTWWTWWKYIDQQMSNFFCGSPFLRQIWRQEPSLWEGLWPPFAMRSGVACARKETSMRQQVGIFWQTDANMRYDMSRAQKALLAESYLGLFTRITYTLYKYWFCYKITH